MFNFAQIRLRTEVSIRRVVERTMIYTLTAILVPVGAAASAVAVIAIWERARRLGADGDNGEAKAASVGGLLH
jgi:hypothetical protein